MCFCLFSVQILINTVKYGSLFQDAILFVDFLVELNLVFLHHLFIGSLIVVFVVK